MNIGFSLSNCQVNGQSEIIGLTIGYMERSNQTSLADKALKFILTRSAILIFNTYLRLWRLFKHRVLSLKDRRTIYGKMNGRLIIGTPENRNEPTCIIGQPGFGKSGEAVNLAIQDIEQGEAGYFIDPHGNPQETEEDKKGAVVKIFERVQHTRNVSFLSLNQRTKIIGYNPLFLIGIIDELSLLKDDLLNAIFWDCFKEGFEVINSAKLLIESAIYFHSAYADWLMQVKGKTNEQIKIILQSHQITFNDLANLKRDSQLIDLFIEILSFPGSQYRRLDLVDDWLKIKAARTFDRGMRGTIGRIDRIVTPSKAQLFFESHGFNLIEERKKGKFVLCDTSGLDPFTNSIISKLLFTKISTVQTSGIFKNKASRTYFDEAAYLAMPNLAHMISQGRKFFLDLTLIIQYKKQFENTQDIIAVREACVNRLYFRSLDPEYNAPIEKIANLEKREFLFISSKGVYENVKTLDMPPIKRSVELIERGEGKEELRQRIMTKKTDILGYFINV